MENGEVDSETVQKFGESESSLFAGVSEPAVQALASGVDEGTEFQVEAVGEEAHECGVELAIHFSFLIGRVLVTYEVVAFDDEVRLGGEVRLASGNTSFAESPGGEARRKLRDMEPFFGGAKVGAMLGLVAIVNAAHP